MGVFAVDSVQGQFVTFPGSPFELFQPYPPAGDQPTAISQLVEGVLDGEVFQTLLGVTGSGETRVAAVVPFYAPHDLVTHVRRRSELRGLAGLIGRDQLDCASRALHRSQCRQK